MIALVNDCILNVSGVLQRDLLVHTWDS